MESSSSPPQSPTQTPAKSKSENPRPQKETDQEQKLENFEQPELLTTSSKQKQPRQSSDEQIKSLPQLLQRLTISSENTGKKSDSDIHLNIKRTSTLEFVPKLCRSSAYQKAVEEDEKEKSNKWRNKLAKEKRGNEDQQQQQQQHTNEKSKTISTKYYSYTIINPEEVENFLAEKELPKDNDNEDSHARTIKSTSLLALPRFRMRQPFKILSDIWGVLTSYHFRDQLFEYVDRELERYVAENYVTNVDIANYVRELAARTADDIATGTWPDMPTISMPCDDRKSNLDANSNLITAKSSEQQPQQPEQQAQSTGKIAQLAKSVSENLRYRQKHPTDKRRLMRNGLDRIFNPIWNDGYRTRRLRPQVFADVSPALERWRSDPFFVKIFTFATGDFEAQKLFLSAADVGDVSQYVTYGFDARGSYKYDFTRYRQVVSSLTERDARNLFYLTDSPRKGREARRAGLTVFIVRRDGNRRYRPEDLSPFVVIDSLQQFDFYEFK